MADQQGPQSFGKIIANSVALYRREWPVLFSIVAVSAPLSILSFPTPAPDGSVNASPLEFGAGLVGLFGDFLVSAALTLAICQIHLGREIGVLEVYRSVLRRFWPLLGASLAAFLMVLAGALLLFLPGVYLALRYYFVIPVVMLERLDAAAALRRSADLARGFYLRNLGVILGSALIFGVVIVVVAVLCGALATLVGHLTGAADTGVILGLFISRMVSLPLAIIPGVMLYFDMVGRKNGAEPSAPPQSV